MKRVLALAGLAAVPLAVLGVFFLLPITGMLAEGFWADGTFDPGAVADVLTRPRVQRVIWFTVWSSVVATACAVLLGVPAAHLLHPGTGEHVGHRTRVEGAVGPEPLGEHAADGEQEEHTEHGQRHRRQPRQREDASHSPGVIAR